MHENTVVAGLAQDGADVDVVEDVRAAFSASWALRGVLSGDAAGEERLAAARSALGECEAGAVGEARSWSNPYEGLGRETFVCRSALKLAALDAAFGLVGERCGFVDVCAAPGGFSEYASWRCASLGGRATGVATSLVGANGDGSGAEWRAGDCGGAVAFLDGDVYDEATRRRVVEAAMGRLGGARPSLVVADGGFDANAGAADQDLGAAKLVACEFAVAVAALGEGGAMVLKVFSPLRARATAAMVHAASRLFDAVHVCKPLPSRASSGEAYLVGVSFRPLADRARAAVVAVLDEAIAADPRPEGGGTPPTAGLERTLAFLDGARRRLVASQADACETILRRAAGLPVDAPPRADVARYERLWRLEGAPKRRKAPTRKRPLSPSKEEKRPFVVGVVGPSGVGKSSLAEALAESLGAVYVKEDPRFFLKSCPKSYEYRDPVSEEPGHVDWRATAAETDRLLATGDVAVLEHYLLLAPGGGRDWLQGKCDCILFLDPGVGPTEDPPASSDACRRCRERRVGRTAGRPDAEIDHLRAYYDAHVWPAFVKYTLAPFRALSADVPCAVLDASRPAAAVLSDALAAVSRFRRS